MKTAIIIPAYNEEKSIYKLVKSIYEMYENITVLVINDGSTDNTYNEALRAGADVINLPMNVGIGGAVQTGYIYANERDIDIAVQIDGDGQHNPKDLKKILEPIINKEADMVIGSRFLEKTDYKPSLFRKIGIKYFSFLISYIAKQKFTDTTSGYRAFDKKVISMFADYYPHDYPEVETVALACKNNLKVMEVSVDMNERKTGRSSITPIKAIYYMIKVTFAVLFLKGGK